MNKTVEDFFFSVGLSYVTTVVTVTVQRSTVIDTDHYFQLACYWYVPIAPASDAAAIGRM